MALKMVYRSQSLPALGYLADHDLLDSDNRGEALVQGCSSHTLQLATIRNSEHRQSQDSWWMLEDCVAATMVVVFCEGVLTRCASDRCRVYNDISLCNSPSTPRPHAPCVPLRQYPSSLEDVDARQGLKSKLCTSEGSVDTHEDTESARH
jgi:hypothetical protein